MLPITLLLIGGGRVKALAVSMREDEHKFLDSRVLVK